MVVTGSDHYRQMMAVIHSFWVSKGRVEQVTAIHRVNIMEFRTGLFNGDRYRHVTVIQSGRYSRFDCICRQRHHKLLIRRIQYNLDIGLLSLSNIKGNE